MSQSFQIYPLWIAPNVLTFSGFLLLVMNFVAMIYYDLDFYASSRDHPEFPPVPNWMWLVCAINTFLSHTLGRYLSLLHIPVSSGFSTRFFDFAVIVFG